MRPTGEFFLEIGCEEIPAGVLPHGAAELQQILTKYFSSAGLLESAEVSAWGAPRRLVAQCPALRMRQADVEKEVIGPPKAVAYDSVGAPTRAAESFAAKQGVAISKVYLVTTARGEYLAARQMIRGRTAAQIVAEVLPQAIREIPWPRAMYWTSLDGPRFIRPIRWLVALLGGKIVPFAAGGVTAGNKTSGHRFLGREKIRVRGSADYARRLRSNFVIADPAARRAKIESGIASCLSGRGLMLKADADLLERVTYLNEFPTVIRGGFDPAYLELPEEILLTVMRDHQKYFGVTQRDGSLAPHFLAVINLDGDRRGQVRAGHERVLSARFADAKFFWQSDQKCRLADRLPRLAHITYESRLGSYADKVERIRWMARWLAEQWFSAGVREADVPSADRAAELAKCDLTTEMVREFPELQGAVGGLYARVQGEPESICWAIYDQYRPAALEADIPRNLTGCAVAMADKLDALAGCFLIGRMPSGSSDPFALRRAALGVVKILTERKLPLSLSAAVAAVARCLAQHPPRMESTAEVQAQVLEFLLERARFVFRETLGFAYDEVNAVLAAGHDDLVDAARRLEALHAIRKTKNFEPLAAAFKRIRKILEKAGAASDWKYPAVRPELLVEDAEKDLHTAACKVAHDAGEKKRAGQYREALLAISALRPAVDRFFDDVLVMAEQEEARRNRLTLLYELLREFSVIADFSELGAREIRA